ncbi:unnamed protein product [Malus baccata var. baccata]
MAGSGSSEVRTPIFKGDNYEFWSIKMKTIFKSHGLWDLVEKGFERSDSKDDGESDGKKKEKEESSSIEKLPLAERLMKDAKALGLIQGAVSDEIFPRISYEETSKGAWDTLQQEYHGDKQVRNVKLQGLRREFEYTRMRDDESLSDLDVIEVQEVVASLKSFELRLDRHSEHKTEKAFASLNVNPKPAKFTGNQSARYHKNWKEKGKKWDNKSTDGARNPCKHCDKLHFGECRFKGKPKCYNCEKFGHIARDCNSMKPVQQLNYANKVESTPTMFYASNQTFTSVKDCDDVWYVDSGCSNHMTGREDLLVDIDRNVTAKVEMGTGQLVDVTGKGSLVVETKLGKRYIKEVMLVPGLKENLLSVGQMMEHGYYLVFGGHKVEIYDDSSYSNMVAKVPMKGNRSFPMKLQTGIHIAFKANVCVSTTMWHKRLGHLNMSSLKLMQE